MPNDPINNDPIDYTGYTGPIGPAPDDPNRHHARAINPIDKDDDPVAYWIDEHVGPKAIGRGLEWLFNAKPHLATHGIEVIKRPVNKSQPIETLTPTIKIPTATPDKYNPYAAEDIAFDKLKRVEGWHPKGILVGGETTYTAGWGSKLKPNSEGIYNVKIGKDEVLSRDEADKIARGRIRNEFIPKLAKIDPYWKDKNPNQQAAMLGYMHQTGSAIDIEKTKGSTQLKKQVYINALKSKNWVKDIPAAMLALHMSDPTMQKGVDRRQRELVELFNKPYNPEERANLIDQDLIDYPNIK